MRRHFLTLVPALSILVAVVAASAEPVEPLPTFGKPVRVGSSGYEPGIDLADTGTLYVNDPSGNHSLWKSTDGGAKWNAVPVTGNSNRYPGGFDSDVATGHGENVYYLDLWVGSNSLLHSKDEGKTWEQGTPFTTLPLSDRQWIAVGPQDPETGEETVYALYALIQPPSWAMFARSTDSGKTWTHHTPVPAAGQASGFTGQMVANDAGFVAFSYVQSNRFWVAYSHDEGTTWARSEIPFAIPFSGHIQGLALDGETLHVVFVNRVHYQVMYSRSDDLGATWTWPEEITSPGSHMFPWVAARDGKVSVAWYGSDTPSESPADPNELGAAALWHLGYAESLDGGQTFSSPVKAFAGTVHTGHICTEGILCRSGRQLGDFLQVVIAADGKAIITYGSRINCPCGTVVVKQTS